MDREKRKKILTHNPPRQMKIGMLMMGLSLIIQVITYRIAPPGEFPLPFVIFMLFVDAGLLWWIYIFTTQIHVIIYDDGIELVRGGARLFAKWDNVSHLGTNGSRNQLRGIHLHKKVKPAVNGFIEKFVFGQETDFISLARYVYLPLNKNSSKRGIDTEKLLETEFGKTLYEYAPHLFDEDSDIKPKKHLEDDFDEQDEYSYDEDMMLDEQDKR